MTQRSARAGYNTTLFDTQESNVLRASHVSVRIKTCDGNSRLRTVWSMLWKNLCRGPTSNVQAYKNHLGWSMMCISIIIRFRSAQKMTEQHGIISERYAGIIAIGNFYPQDTKNFLVLSWLLANAHTCFRRAQKVQGHFTFLKKLGQVSRLHPWSYYLREDMLPLKKEIGSLHTSNKTAGMNENTAFNATRATQFFVTKSPPFFW